MDTQTYEQELGGMEQSLMGFKNSKLRDYSRVQNSYEKSLEVAKSGFDKSELLSKTLEELGAGGIGLVEGAKGLIKGGKKLYKKFKKGKSSQNEADEDDTGPNTEDISEDYDLDGLEADTDNVFEKIGSKIASNVSDIGEQAISSVKNAVSNVSEFAQNTMENAFNGVKNKINQFKENFNREDNMIDRASNQGSSENSGFGDKTDANMGKGDIEMKDMGNKGANEKVYDQEGNELSNEDFDPNEAVEGTDVTLEGGEETTTGVSEAVTTGVDTGIETAGELATDATIDAVAAGSQALDWIPFVGELTMLFGLGATIVDGAVQAANAGKKYTQNQNAADTTKNAANQRIAQVNPAGHYAVASLNPVHNFQQ
jgi:hypothetical protein